MSEMRQRVMGPAAVPVVAVLFIGVATWSVSRILVAVDKNQAVVVAFAVAFNIVLGAAALAIAPRLSRAAVRAGLVLAFAAVLGAGIAGWQVGERVVGHAASEGAGEGHGNEEEEPAGAPAPSIPEGAIEVSAKNIAFDTDALEFEAGSDVVIVFENQDPDLHNIAVYTDESAADAIFKGDVFPGPAATHTYEFPAPAAGTYFFRCDVHPAMNGTVTVTG